VARDAISYVCDGPTPENVPPRDFSPKADKHLFDHLICAGQQDRWKFEPE
jgi:hypothetical protein